MIGVGRLYANVVSAPLMSIVTTVGDTIVCVTSVRVATVNGIVPATLTGRLKVSVAVEPAAVTTQVMGWACIAWPRPKARRFRALGILLG